MKRYFIFSCISLGWLYHTDCTLGYYNLHKNVVYIYCVTEHSVYFVFVYIFKVVVEAQEDIPCVKTQACPHQFTEKFNQASGNLSHWNFLEFLTHTYKVTTED